MTADKSTTSSWYKFFKHYSIGPFLRVWNRPTVEGVDNFPATGGAVIVSNHQSVFDSFFLPLLCPREITFLAKKEYFTNPGLVGKVQAWFFRAVGQVPIDREDTDAAHAAMRTAMRVVNEGKLVGIYPEGTRSPDGRLFKGKTGAIRVAIKTGAPLVPVAMLGTREANPPGTWIVRPRKVGMIVGEPIDPAAFLAERNLDPDSYEGARALTDHVMDVIGDMSGQDYVHVYAADVKKALAAGEGYPPGTEPRQI